MKWDKKPKIRRILIISKFRSWVKRDLENQMKELKHKLSCNYVDAVYDSMLNGGTEKFDKIFE
jgi:hypothetical protein